MSEMLRVQCPQCGAGFRVASDHLGRAATCPSCKNRFVLQAPSPAMAVSVPVTTSVPTPHPVHAPPPDDPFAGFDSAPAAAPRPVAIPAAAGKKAKGGEWIGMAAGGGALVISIVALVWIVNSSSPASSATLAPANLDKVGPTLSAGTKPIVKPVVSGPLYAVPRNPDGSRPTLSTKDLVKYCGPSVAFIKGKAGSGSGFLLTDGIVGTNHHVVASEFIEDIEVEFPDAKQKDRGPFKAELLYESPRRDIVFLQIKDCGLPPLELGDDFEFAPGESVVAIGSPGKGGGDVLKNSIAPGTLSTRDTVKEVDWFEFKGVVAPGNSGGPVFDMSGRVIGVVTLKSTVIEGANWCIPNDELIAHFKQMNYRTAEEKKANGARHRMDALARRLIFACENYSAGLEAFVRYMREANSQGFGEAEITQRRRQFFEEGLKQIEKMLPEKLDEIVESVKKDEGTPPEAKEIFTKLVEAFRNFKAYFEQIKGIEKPTNEDLKKILAKRNELTEAYVKLRDELVKSLESVLD